MKRFKRILLYAGGQVDAGPAFERAADLASANGARLTIIDVLPKSPPSPWRNVTGQPDLKLLVSARCDELKELAALSGHGIEVETKVLTGRPFVEIIREVLRAEHDLVVKVAQGLGGRLGGILGSTALHLMRKCPCPVWVIKPDKDNSRRSVLATIDPDLHDSGGHVLSKLVLELGSSLARSQNMELDIVHAWWLWSEAMLRRRRIASPEAVERMLEETREGAEAAVSEALKTVDLSGVKYRVQIIQGMPFQVIAKAAERADIAVMGTLSRTGLAGVLIGNTAERILQQINCSVLAVKPPGFETPIQLPVDHSLQSG